MLALWHFSPGTVRQASLAASLMINRTKLQSLCREAGLDGWAESHEHLSGLEKVLAVFGEPTEAMIEAGYTTIYDNDDDYGRERPHSEDGYEIHWEAWTAPRVWRAMWSSRLGEGG
jgi:hypothetical protein